MRVHVIGVGTRAGDDAAGLAVAESVAQRALPEGVSVHACERPLPDLLDALEGAEAAVIVDAVRGGEPGAVRRLARDELGGRAATSSHGLGVERVLALAAALGRAPRRLALLAVGAGPAEPGAGLSPEVRAAVPRAADAALALARELARDRG